MIAWVAQHPQWAASAVFVLSLAESLVVVGLFIPGTLVMFSVGALVAAGALELWPTLAWAAAGAVAGDGIGYWLGRRYRERLRCAWPLRRHPRLVARGEAFFCRYGGMSVLLGRFIGPVRPMIPAVAGMLGMPPLRFFAVNLLSALAWAPAYVLPGVVFGASVKLAGAIATRLAAMLAALVLAVWFVVWAAKRLVLWVPPRVDRALTSLHAWAAASPRRGWGRELLRALLDPGRPAFRALLPLAALLIAGAWGFAALFEGGVGGNSLGRLDNAVYYLLQGLRTPLADAAMIAVSELGDAAVTLPVVMTVLLWIAWKGASRTAAYWLAAVAFAAVLVPILKKGAFGFGSAGSHAAMSVILYGFLAVLLARAVTARGRRLVFGFAVPLIALIVFSRLYLGAHWLSEVLGGLLFGAAWVALLAVAYFRHGGALLPARSLAAVSLLALSLAGALNVAARHGIDTERYAVRQESRVLSAASWWDDEWRTLPAWRLDIEGADKQPMTLQWAGSPALLREALGAAGWQTPPALSAANLLLLLDTTRSAMALPVLPRVHDGRNAALTLSRPVAEAPDERLVLRLWAAGAVLEETGQPIWAGTVTREAIHRPLGWYNLPHDGNDYNEPREALRRALAGLMVRDVQRSEKALPQERTAAWDGGVLLAMPVTATSREGARE